MKKKFIFITIFASLALIITLSLVLLTNRNNSKILEMEESTEANDELFGDYTEFESPSYELLSSPKAPKLGYQVAVDDNETPENTTDDTISIRFIAQISGLDFTAVWNRQLLKNNGDAYEGTVGTPANKPSTVAYEKLKNSSDGSKSDLVPDTASGYNYFVVYTLKNIPIITANPYKLKVKLTLDNGTDAATESDYRIVVAAEEYDIYFTNNKNWGTVNAYAWNSNGTEKNGDWPGRQMSYYAKNDDDQKVYKITVHRKYDKVIFDNGSGGYGNQTGNTDLVNPYDNAFYVKSDDNNVEAGTWYCAGSTKTLYLNATLWENDANEPLNQRFALYLFDDTLDLHYWVSLDKVDGNYTATFLDYGATSVIFVRLWGGSGNTFDGKRNQTGNLTISNGIGKICVITDWNSGEWQNFSS